jgi:hypothetical protein
MEFISLLFILATGIHWLNVQGQRKRTALLAAAAGSTTVMLAVVPAPPATCVASTPFTRL